MLKLFPQDENETIIPKPTVISRDNAADLGRVIAPIAAPEPLETFRMYPFLIKALT